MKRARKTRTWWLLVREDASVFDGFSSRKIAAETRTAFGLLRCEVVEVREVVRPARKKGKRHA